MISRSEKNLIRQLHRRTIRDQEHLFLCEGPKIVGELLNLPPDSDFQIKILILERTEQSFSYQSATNPPERVELVSKTEFEQLSHQKNPNQVLALVTKPMTDATPPNPVGNLILALDDIQDPGNTGTILRLADWFGIHAVVGSPDTADFFNPKVVQASMGSIFRTQLHIQPLDLWLDQLPDVYPVYGTDLSGENIYHTNLSTEGIILLGNESRGLHPKLKTRSSTLIRIPDFNPSNQTSDSLNVSLAAAIICSEFKRRG